ncbi:RecQ family ATP-dependent DNA helicase [Thalassobacillus devorans]|uniref:RecQ family ATP-dependent DNA helicase n=1 Tax=Thalassobacillus devorans TaxID=279813 RepID=UPI000A1CE413|nr:ATP-dependent DNA helicase RecQ [Thalassobacillus devorans]
MNDRLLENKLKMYFGFDTFKQGQKEIIRDVMAGEDTLGILPTGSGKSVCYQLPAMITEGITIVVSPLVSLMIDQVKELKANGYKQVTAINSFLSVSQKQQVFDQLSRYKLIYLSPEMLQNETVIRRLKMLKVSFFVVDEAHCISQWGHEFRTDYLKLSTVIAELNHPPVLALSGTATPEVQGDIIKQLGLKRMKQHIYPMDKENISFVVEHVENPDEKLRKISKALHHQDAPAMIYFSSRNWAERASIELSSKMPEKRIAYYHGGMEQADRLLIQQQFMNDQLDIICCTNAFGMGINKKNIRYVIHFHLPTQTESFIQEVGRAGRDGNHSISIVYYSPSDDYLPKKLIQSELPEPAHLKAVLDYLLCLYQANALLPSDEMVQDQLELSENQWRFFKYHFYRNGLLDNKKVVFNEKKWKEFYELLKERIENRYHYKMARFSELLTWVHHRNCRREKLYQAFQDTVKPPVVPCCDQCGFQLHDFSFGESERNTEQESWEERLYKIFLAGGQA